VLLASHARKNEDLTGSHAIFETQGAVAVSYWIPNGVMISISGIPNDSNLRRPSSEVVPNDVVLYTYTGGGRGEGVDPRDRGAQGRDRQASG
jgi:hypothetical protein